jgi:regulator of replication initiation timing
MEMKDLQETYTAREMVKMFLRVDDLTRGNIALQKDLEAVKTELAQARSENADLTAQLDDLQRDIAQQMTAPRIL